MHSIQHSIQHSIAYSTAQHKTLHSTAYKIVLYSIIQHIKKKTSLDTIAFFRTKALGWTDERVKVINEAIAGMKVIKMYTWEKSFSEWITKLRKYVTPVGRL